MLSFQEIVAWLWSFFTGGAQIVGWLTTEIKVGNLGTFTPLGLLTYTGLVVLIPAAIWTWFKSIFI